VTLRSSCRR